MFARMAFAQILLSIYQYEANCVICNVILLTFNIPLLNQKLSVNDISTFCMVVKKTLIKEIHETET